MNDFVQPITPLVHANGLRFARSVVAPRWQIPGVRAFSTLRGPFGSSIAPFDRFNLGERCGDDPAAVAANRAGLIAQGHLPAAPRWLQQVHGAEVVRLGLGLPDGDRLGNDVPQADAAVSDQAGVVLAILHADCLPVLFAAADGSEVAAAHAGWRGLAGGVLEATIRKLRSDPSHIHAWLGPCAGAATYEVGEDVRQAFVDADPASAASFRGTRPGHWLCDLPSLAIGRLKRLGVGLISGGDQCTISDPERYFSHRRDGRSGRMASLIWQEPKR